MEVKVLLTEPMIYGKWCSTWLSSSGFKLIRVGRAIHARLFRNIHFVANDLPKHKSVTHIFLITSNIWIIHSFNEISVTSLISIAL